MPDLLKTPLDFRTEAPSRFARRFFLVTSAAFAAAGGIAWGLTEVTRDFHLSSGTWFPPAFAASTLLLLAGSVKLQSAIQQVRRERQEAFRKALRNAVIAGVLFVGVQSYGLWSLNHNRPLSDDAQMGVTAFAFMLTSLHGLHITVALMFLIFVMLKAQVDRYDHEYYWGVTVCAWFWHFLGIVWMAILAVFLIAAAHVVVAA